MSASSPRLPPNPTSGQEDAQSSTPPPEATSDYQPTGRPDLALARTDLAQSLEQARIRGEVLVFTNGCFDLLHVGHVRLLQQARSLGDRLIVGVNSDASVRGLNKGSERPLVGEADRAEVLAALGCVDHVVIFDEATPVETILQLRPHIHVKGGDYRPDTLVETPAVASVGGRIVIIPLVEGRSTTKLVRRMHAPTAPGVPSEHTA